jgi:hypothetical protein
MSRPTLDRIGYRFLCALVVDLAMGKAHEMSEYLTEDALLDVDGTVAKGIGEQRDNPLPPL